MALSRTASSRCRKCETRQHWSEQQRAGPGAGFASPPRRAGNHHCTHAFDDIPGGTTRESHHHHEQLLRHRLKRGGGFIFGVQPKSRGEPRRDNLISAQAMSGRAHPASEVRRVYGGVLMPPRSGTSASGCGPARKAVPTRRTSAMASSTARSCDEVCMSIHLFGGAARQHATWIRIAARSSGVMPVREDVVVVDEDEVADAARAEGRDRVEVFPRLVGRATGPNSTRGTAAAPAAPGAGGGGGSASLSDAAASARRHGAAEVAAHERGLLLKFHERLLGRRRVDGGWPMPPEAPRVLVHRRLRRAGGHGALVGVAALDDATRCPRRCARDCRPRARRSRPNLTRCRT